MVILGSIFFIGNVKASGIEDIQQYAPNITDENIQSFYEINNLDPSIQDTYFAIVYEDKYSKIRVKMCFFNYQELLDGTINLEKGKRNGYPSYSFVSLSNNLNYDFVSFSVYGNNVSGSTNNISEFPNITPGIDPSNSTFSYGIIIGKDYNNYNEVLAYYTNRDIIFPDGTVWLEANSNEEPTYTYEVLEKENGLELKFTFENFNNEGYFYQLNDINNPNIIYNMNPPMENYALSLDYNTIWEFILYNSEGVVSSEIIDVTGLYEKDYGEYSVVLRRDPTHDNGNAFRYYYYTSIKDLLGNMSWNGVSCYHGSINGQVSSWYEDDCSSTELSISSTSNEVLQWKIVIDNPFGDPIIAYERQYAVINDESSPFITFDVVNNPYGYDVSIIGNNMTDNHYLVYKLNNEISEHQISSGTTLSIYKNTRIYAYIYSLNNTIVASSYKDIVVDLGQHTTNSSNNNNNNNGGSFTDFRNSLSKFLKPINFIMSNISNFYNNYMPLPLQSFLFFIFSLTVIIIVIRIIF